MRPVFTEKALEYGHLYLIKVGKIFAASSPNDSIDRFNLNRDGDFYVCAFLYDKSILVFNPPKKHAFSKSEIESGDESDLFERSESKDFHTVLEKYIAWCLELKNRSSLDWYHAEFSTNPNGSVSLTDIWKSEEYASPQIKSILRTPEEWKKTGHFATSMLETVIDSFGINLVQQSNHKRLARTAVFENELASISISAKRSGFSADLSLKGDARLYQERTNKVKINKIDDLILFKNHDNYWHIGKSRYAPEDVELWNFTDLDYSRSVMNGRYITTKEKTSLMAVTDQALSFVLATHYELAPFRKNALRDWFVTSHAFADFFMSGAPDITPQELSDAREEFAKKIQLDRSFLARLKNNAKDGLFKLPSKLLQHLLIHKFTEISIIAATSGGGLIAGTALGYGFNVASKTIAQSLKGIKELSLEAILETHPEFALELLPEAFDENHPDVLPIKEINLQHPRIFDPFESDDQEALEKPRA